MKTTSYHRDVIRWLERHGATAVRLVPGAGRTSHPRLAFVWKGEERKVLVSASPSDPQAVMIKILDLKHMLGVTEADATESPRQKRKLEDMMPQTDWKDMLAAHPAAHTATSGVYVRPLEHTITKDDPRTDEALRRASEVEPVRMTCKVARYAHQIRFRALPEAVVTVLGDAKLTVTHVSLNEWHLRPDPTLLRGAHVGITNSGYEVSFSNRTDNDPTEGMLFASCDADVTIDGDTVKVRRQQPLSLADKHEIGRTAATAILPSTQAEEQPMPEAQVIDMQPKAIKPRVTAMVPWPEVEPLIAQLRAALDCSQDDAMKYIGYTGTAVASWVDANQAPTRARYALIGALHDLGIKRAYIEPPIVRQFDHDELTALFGVLAGFAVPEERRKALVTKVAVELAR